MWPVRMADNLTDIKCRLSRNVEASTSWNPVGLSRPVMGLLFNFNKIVTTHCDTRAALQTRTNAREQATLQSDANFVPLRQRSNYYAVTTICLHQTHYSNWNVNI
jgi:hypothetical protein